MSLFLTLTMFHGSNGVFNKKQGKKQASMKVMVYVLFLLMSLKKWLSSLLKQQLPVQQKHTELFLWFRSGKRTEIYTLQPRVAFTLPRITQHINSILFKHWIYL